MRLIATLILFCSVHVFAVTEQGTVKGDSLAVAAQQGDGDGLFSWDDFVLRMSGMDDENQAFEAELMEQLEQMHMMPVNINTITVEELTRLPFIDEQKAGDIVKYREKNGDFFSLGELMMIRSLSRDDREMLRLFVRVEPAQAVDTRITWDKLRNFKPIHSEVVLRSDIPFYTKAGFGDYPDGVLQRSPNKVYQGDRFHHSLRFSISAGKHLVGGLQMEKDAGESGIDYVSAYVMVRDLGVVHRAIAGNYRVSFGQGLIVNNVARFGKMMMLGNIGRIDAGISRHSSMTEDGFMTGAAATLAFGKVLVSAFASKRKADGTVRGDSIGISSLKTDGLHRTKLEQSKDGNLAISNLGGNVHWGTNNFGLSATFIATHLSVPLAPEHGTSSSLYRLYNAHGKDFQNVSIAYSWRNNHVSIAGETAFSHAQGLNNPVTRQIEGRQNGFATLNSLQWRANSNHTFTAIARWYGAKFVSLNGKAFGENSSVQNEEGIFVGWTGRVSSSWKFNAYADLMYFPWLKYQVGDSSRGFEGMLQADFSPNKRLSLQMRYRVKSKECDYDFIANKQELTVLKFKTSHNLRLQLSNSLSPFLTMRTTAIGTIVHFAGSAERGFSITENVRWQNRKKARIDVGLTYFDTDSYNSRIYAYEPTLLYAYGFTTYYYRGIRSALLVSIPIFNTGATLTAKFASTLYINREQIGSGLDLIDNSHREDLQLQVRWSL